MNLPVYISKRISGKTTGGFSAQASTIATVGIALGLAVMIIAFAVLFGFKNEIQNKIFSFGGHLQLSRYDLNYSFEENPVRYNQKFLETCLKNQEIKSVHGFANKAGLLKTAETVHGAVLKGIENDYDTNIFKSNLLEGSFPTIIKGTGSTEMLISKKIANALRLKLNDQVLMFFIQEPPRYRKMKIVGIYQTGMEEFDEIFLLGDLNLIRRLNDWSDTLTGGYEVMVKDFNHLESVSEFIYNEMDYDLGIEKVTDKYIQIFDWLSMLDRNVYIFLIIILIVACFNMISSLIILLMERTQMIGILKSIGASQSLLARVFYWNGIKIILKGLLLGNIIGVGFCWLQETFKIIPLNPEHYYMSYVPVEWGLQLVLISNLTLLILLSLVIWLPLKMISNISIVKALRFS